MPNPEVKISEISPSEAQQVVDGLVRSWGYYTTPSRRDGRPFRREDITVKKVTVPDIKYPIYVCVPRDIRAESADIDVVDMGMNTSLVAPYIDRTNHYGGDQGTVSYISLLLNKGMPVDSMEHIHLHTYGSGFQMFVAMPDNTELTYAADPWHVQDHLSGHPIQAMTMMCGFSRQAVYLAHIAVFTKPIVK